MIDMTQYAVTEVDQHLLGKAWKGSVDSVFSKACNVQRDDGELVVLMDNHQSMLPNSIAITSFDELANDHLVPGRGLSFDGQNLEVADLGELDFAGADLWSGQMRELARIPDAQHYGNWQTLAEVAIALRPLIVKQASWHPWLFEGPLFRRETCQSISHLLEPHVAAVEVADVLSRLLGLGPGLTPSGDDFVVGYLAALQGFPHLHPPEVLSELHRQLTPILGRRTTRVGAHYLASALSGRFSQSVIDLAEAFAQQSPEILTGGAQQLVAMGHSSGLDTCYGFLTGSYLPSEENFEIYKRLFPPMLRLANKR